MRATANVLQAPKVTIFNGQQALLCDCTHSPYVVGIHYDSDGLQQPKIAVIDEGIKLSIRATECGDAKQAHLEGHLDRLPAMDLSSRAIVSQMKDDEARHALAAQQAGAASLPWPVRLAMRAAARIMTTTAHFI